MGQVGQVGLVVLVGHADLAVRGQFVSLSLLCLVPKWSSHAHATALAMASVTKGPVVTVFAMKLGAALTAVAHLFLALLLTRSTNAPGTGIATQTRVHVHAWLHGQE